MSGFRITIRLTSEEWQALRKICPSNNRGDMTQSEMIRLLIAREAERRFGIKLPSPWGELRQGRPKKPKNAPKLSDTIL